MNEIDMVLKEKDGCKTLKRLLENYEKICEQDLIKLSKVFFIILMDNRVKYLEKKDIERFIEIIDKNYIPNLFQQIQIFIKKDSYALESKPLKNILYKYFIERYYLHDGVKDFCFDKESSKKKKLISIDKQKIYFETIKNTGMIRPLQKLKLFSSMAMFFHKNIAQDIKKYVDVYNENMNKKYEDVDFAWNFNFQHEIMNLNSGIEIINKTRECLINEINGFLNKSDSTESYLPIVSINNNCGKIDFKSNNFKYYILVKYSSILNKALKKESFEEIILTRNLFSKKESYFFDKIIKFIEMDMLYDALKESIIFIESTLRDSLTELNKEILEYDISAVKEKKENFIRFMKYIEEKQKNWKENDLLLDISYLTVSYNDFIDNYSLGDVQVKSNLMNTLINNSVQEKLLREEDLFFLKFLLLNDNGEGLNLRNNIIHGLKNEFDFYEMEVKENNKLIFKLTIFYILACIISIKRKGP